MSAATTGLGSALKVVIDDDGFDIIYDTTSPPPRLPKPLTPEMALVSVLRHPASAATPNESWADEKASKSVVAKRKNPAEIMKEEGAFKPVKAPVKAPWTAIAQINVPAGALLSGTNIAPKPAATVEKAQPEEENDSERERRKEGDGQESVSIKEEDELPTMSSEAKKQEYRQTSRILLPVFAKDFHTTAKLLSVPQSQKKAFAPIPDSILSPPSPAATTERATLEDKNKRRNMLRGERRKKKRWEDRETKRLISAAEEDELLPNMTADTREHERHRPRRILPAVSQRTKDLLTETKLKPVPQRVEDSQTTTDPLPVPQPQKTAAVAILKRPPPAAMTEAAPTETAPRAIILTKTASEEKNKRKKDRRKERKVQGSSLLAEDELLAEMRTGSQEKENEKPRTKRKSSLLPRQSDNWRIWIKTTPVHQEVEDDHVKTNPTKVPKRPENLAKDQWDFDAYDTLKVILEAIQGLLYHGSEAHSDIEDTVMGLHELTPMLTSDHLQSAQHFVDEEFQRKMEAMHESKSHLDRIGRRLKKVGIKNNADLVAYRKAMLRVLLPKEKAERRAAVERREEEREAKRLVALSPAKREEKKREAHEEEAELGAQMPETKRDRKSDKIVDKELSSWVGMLEKKTGIKRDRPLVPQWKRKQAVPGPPPNATQHIAHQGSAAAQRSAPLPFDGAVERQVAEIQKKLQQVNEQAIQETKARASPDPTYGAEIEATPRAAREFIVQTAKTFRTSIAPDAKIDPDQMEVIKLRKANAATPPGAGPVEFQKEATHKAASELNEQTIQNLKMASKSGLGMVGNAEATAPRKVTRHAVQEASSQAISAVQPVPAAPESFQITAEMFNIMMSRISQLEAGTAAPTLPLANPQAQVSPEPSRLSHLEGITTEESVRSSRPSGRKKQKK